MSLNTKYERGKVDQCFFFFFECFAECAWTTLGTDRFLALIHGFRTGTRPTTLSDRAWYTHQSRTVLRGRQLDTEGGGLENRVFRPIINRLRKRNGFFFFFYDRLRMRLNVYNALRRSDGRKHVAFQ